MKYKFNTKEDAIEKLNTISTPHSHKITHYNEDEKYVIEIEWDGNPLWSNNKKKKDDKSK
tara:strand:+ start:775 stop:954 length:180 start_codon:yes stop_codon:yes gene_type:complete